MREDGFTLIEILMVVSLVGILAAIAVTQYKNYANDARTAITRQKLTSLRIAITGDGRFNSGGVPTKPGYETNCLGLPSTLTDLVTQPAAGTCHSNYDPYLKQGWRGPYVSSVDSDWNKDAWGTAINYDSGGRTLKSCGPDKSCGNADDISISF